MGIGGFIPRFLDPEGYYDLVEKVSKDEKNEKNILKE